MRRFQAEFEQNKGKSAALMKCIAGCKKNLKLNKKQIERRGLLFETSISEGYNYKNKFLKG